MFFGEALHLSIDWNRVEGDSDHACLGDLMEAPCQAIARINGTTSSMTFG